ncbi:hypothetical protein HMPREF0239_03082 [Clostridium sp. ATCC BAA-442]|nr:hypothetical protein HMPREF0239_03082 [Clostridium sp. ATCC BAA-442]
MIFIVCQKKTSKICAKQIRVGAVYPPTAAPCAEQKSLLH